MNTIAYELEKLTQVRTRPVMSSPLAYVERHESDLVNYTHRGAMLVDGMMNKAHETTHRLTAQLRTLSPQNTLERGYAIVRGAHGAILTTVSSVTSGDAIRVQVADGEISATAD